MRNALAGVAGVALLAALANGALADDMKKVTGSLTIAQAAEATMLDITRYRAGVDTYIMGNVFEMLTQPDPTLKGQNWLAEKWNIHEEDGKPVIEVWLRKGVKFHHGGELTSKDMVYVQQRLSNKDIATWPHYQKNVERIEVIDDHHFKIRFSGPDGLYIPNNLQLYGISKDYYESHTEEQIQAAPDGTGPWQLVGHKVKEEFNLVAHDDYWNKDHRPGVKNLTVKIIPEDLTRVAALQTGAVDWIDAVPPAMVDDVKKMDGIVTTSRPSGNNIFMSMAQYLDKLPGQDTNPLKDVRVRKAMAMAVDMDGIIEGVLFGQGERYAAVTPGGNGYDPDLKGHPYDVEQAKKLMAEAGYANGFDLNCYNLITPREPNIKEFGEAVYAYLGQIGVRCNLIGEEYAAWLARNARSREPQNDGILLHMWGQGVVADPGQHWAGSHHCYREGSGFGSYSHFCDDELDKLVAEQTTIMDPAVRNPLLQKIGQMTVDKVAGIKAYIPLVTFAWREAKVDYKPWPWLGFWRKLQEIGLKQ